MIKRIAFLSLFLVSFIWCMPVVAGQVYVDPVTGKAQNLPDNIKAESVFMLRTSLENNQKEGS